MQHWAREEVTLSEPSQSPRMSATPLTERAHAYSDGDQSRDAGAGVGGAEWEPAGDSGGGRANPHEVKFHRTARE